MHNVALQREWAKEKNTSIKYRDLFANFEVTMDATCNEQNVGSEFPVTLCINAFRGYLDEFIKNVNSKKKDGKFKKKKERPNRRDNKKKDILVSIVLKPLLLNTESKFFSDALKVFILYTN